MTWTKLSDDYSEEAWTLTDAAYRLHTEMLNYSNRKLLDCAIPKDEMRLFAKRPEAIDELVSTGYCTDEGDKWRIQFQSLYQRTRLEVIKDRAVRAENGKKGGRPPKVPRQGGPGTGQLTGQLTGTETGRDGLKDGHGREGSAGSAVSFAETNQGGQDPIGDAVDALVNSWTGEVREGSQIRPELDSVEPAVDAVSDSTAREGVARVSREVAATEARPDLSVPRMADDTSAEQQRGWVQEGSRVRRVKSPAA